jgi:hypothetical protein
MIDFVIQHLSGQEASALPSRSSSITKSYVESALNDIPEGFFKLSGLVKPQLARAYEALVTRRSKVMDFRSG